MATVLRTMVFRTLCLLLVLFQPVLSQTGSENGTEGNNNGNGNTGLANQGSPGPILMNLFKFFTDPDVNAEISDFLDALPQNLSSLSSEDQFQNMATALNSSGLGVSVVELMNSAGIDLPDLLNQTDRIAMVLYLLSQSAERQDLAVLRQYGVSAPCQQQVALMVDGLQTGRPWALQMFDAMGKPKAGYLRGNVAWLGAYDECVAVKAVAYGNASLPDTAQQIKGQYCSMLVPPTPATLQSTYFPKLILGLCVPDVCTETDVFGLIQAVENVVLNGTGDFNPRVTCNLNHNPIATETIIFLCVLTVIGSAMVVGTLYDLFAVQPSNADAPHHQPTGTPTTATPASEDKNDNSLSHKDGTKTGMEPVWVVPTNHNSSDSQDRETMFHVPANTVTIPNGHSVPSNDTKPLPTTHSPLAKVLLAFSVYSNVKKLLDTKQAAGSLGSIHGFRFLSMSWIILAHTYYTFFNTSENIYSHLMEKMGDWSFMAIPYGTLAVDTFFALSGLLVAYLFLREMKKTGGILKFSWGMYYFHRFWRLTPSYLMVIVFIITAVRYMSDGPLWEESTDGLREPVFDVIRNNCQNNWWTNLLYINNLVKADEQCLGSFWYLANDMQFFVLSPLLLVPLYYNAIVGGVVCLLFLVATTLPPALITLDRHYPVQSLQPGVPRPKDSDQFTTVYIKPYARMGPYLVGMVTGYILYRTKNTVTVSKVVNVVCWTLAAGILTSSVYGLFGDDGKHLLSVEESAAYFALARTGWGVAVCWIIFACATGHGGIVNEILSWKVFIPLGRLTYGAYLVHPLVMLVFERSRRSFFFGTDYTTAYLFLGHLVVSYGIAFCLSLVVESPMMALEKVLFRRKRRS